MSASSSAAFEDYLDALTIEPVKPPRPARSGRRSWRDATPTADPKLVEAVWDSYTRGEDMLISCPPQFAQRMIRQLQAARRYLYHMHKDDAEKPDIRGLEKGHIDIIIPEKTDPRSEFAQYLPKIRQGEVGIHFLAHPPRILGRRAQMLKEQGLWERQPQADYRRQWRAEQARKAASAPDKEVRRIGTDAIVHDMVEQGYSREHALKHAASRSPAPVNIMDPFAH